MAGQKRIPRGKLGRGRVVGFAAVRAGVKKVGHLTVRPFLTARKKCAADQTNDLAIARIVFNALCTLRGTALKAAQLVAMERGLVPEIYRGELARASSDVPPMNRALVYTILKRELGPPEKSFRQFEWFPFAAASLGQVHAATAFDGRQLAVKVQYPGMADGLKADIEMLRRCLAPTKYRRIFGGCFDEITRRVSEELDYELEARQTTAFGKACSMRDILIPEVATDLSIGSVLSLGRIDGLHLEAWLATSPSQADRDRYGQLLVDFFHYGTFVQHAIHADPHPGNYLYREDGRLGVIDFGCVKHLEPGLLKDLRRLTDPTTLIDLAEHKALHGRLGIHYRSGIDNPSFVRFFSDWVAWLGEPYRTEVFDFGPSHDYFRRGAVLAQAFYRYIDHYDGSFIYYGRAEHGLMRLLERLGARVRMRPIV